MFVLWIALEIKKIFSKSNDNLDYMGNIELKF